LILRIESEIISKYFDSFLFQNFRASITAIRIHPMGIVKYNGSSEIKSRDTKIDKFLIKELSVFVSAAATTYITKNTAKKPTIRPSKPYPTSQKSFPLFLNLCQRLNFFRFKLTSVIATQNQIIGNTSFAVYSYSEPSRPTRLKNDR
jgi:hypothetical protein